MVKGNTQPLWAVLIGMALFGLFLHLVEPGPAEKPESPAAGILEKGKAAR